MCPLNAATKGLVNAKRIDRMQRGSYIINCARGAIADAEAVAEACRSGQLAGYAGDVWNKQPAPKDHPWRTMPHNGMTPHYSGQGFTYLISISQLLKWELA